MCIKIPLCLKCGVPHIPSEIANRVREGDAIDVEIIYPSGVAGNVLRWGTGALNIDGCRIPTSDKLGGGNEKAETAAKFTNEGWRYPWMDNPAALEAFSARSRNSVQKAESLGRWPANLIHDNSPAVLAGFPESASGIHSRRAENANSSSYGFPAEQTARFGGDSGSAARFFYTAKADADDRLGSKHPTVKPVDLMQWLVRLVCPKGATVLDPFAGTGTTGAAAFIEGRRCVLIEREAEYLADIEKRMGMLLMGSEERSWKLAKSEPLEALPLFALTGD